MSLPHSWMLCTSRCFSLVFHNLPSLKLFYQEILDFRVAGLISAYNVGSLLEVVRGAHAGGERFLLAFERGDLAGQGLELARFLEAQLHARARTAALVQVGCRMSNVGSVG